MNINGIIDLFSSGVAAHPALTTWANTTYGRSHKIFVNFDKRNPPGEAECPFVVIYPMSKTAGISVGEKKHAFEVDCCIYDESTRSTGQIIEYNSVRRIEEMRKLVENVLVATDLGNALMQTVDIEYDVIESFPFAWAGMVIEISELFTLGSDPLE